MGCLLSGIINGAVLIGGWIGRMAIQFLAWFGRGCLSLFQWLKCLITEPQAKTSTVKVISKNTSTGGSGIFLEAAYVVVFEFPDGTRKDIPVDIVQYNTAEPNLTGILTYKTQKKKLVCVNFTVK